VAIIAFAVAAIASYRLSPWYERQVDRALKNQIADPQIQGIFGAYQLTLSDEGVRDVGQTGESFCKWSGVAEVVTHGDYIFIRVVSGVAFVISRRSYSGAVPFEELPQVIEEFRKKYAAGN
jgi:hypothetical protein